MSKREELIRKQKEFIFPSVSTFYSEPLVLDRGNMQHVWDIDGREYLDFFGGIVTVSVGHCNPRVTSKLKAQVDKLQHVSTSFVTEPMVALAEKLASIAPRGIKKSYFTNSGTEANETAVQIARMHTGNYELVVLRHGYSGRSSVARAMTGMNTWRKATLEVGIVHAMNPYCYRCPMGLKYPDCGVACAKDVENVIQTSTTGRIAGFLAEPIQGVAGFITPPKEYFKIVFNIVKQYGGDFIADEVQTAWGRTGHKWWGIEHWEVEPDILTSAKGLANGHPVGLTMARPEIADSFQGLTISTFGGNPVTCATAKAVIEVMEEDDLRTNAAIVGGYFRQKLEELQEKHKLIGEVRGMGLMQALELVEDRDTKQPSPAGTNAVLEECRKAGLLVGKGGLYGNVIRMSPPLNITKGDVDEAHRMLDQAFAAVEAARSKAAAKVEPATAGAR
ncbi:MAG: aspartate aminotransferase family protein [Acidobacteriia bacterium]|nr:aspartate aminotransferase family protein [Terriglobia bacterium]